MHFWLFLKNSRIQSNSTSCWNRPNNLISTDSKLDDVCRSNTRSTSPKLVYTFTKVCIESVSYVELKWMKSTRELKFNQSISEYFLILSIYPVSLEQWWNFDWGKNDAIKLFIPFNAGFCNGTMFHGLNRSKSGKLHRWHVYYSSVYTSTGNYELEVVYWIQGVCFVFPFSMTTLSFQRIK